MKLIKESLLKIVDMEFYFRSFKTADIEQSLVIGAHGPKSGYVIFLKSWYNC